ncbi:MAG: hypothetical protein ABWX83_14565 [Luteibacter sp.]
MPSYRKHRARLLVTFLATVGTSAAAYATPPGEFPPPPAFGQPTPVDQLKDMSGGSSTTNNVTEQTLTGTMSETEAKHNVSGGNLISDNALTGASGLPTVIQNSGNNVLIQNATTVIVRMNP